MMNKVAKLQLQTAVELLRLAMRVEDGDPRVEIATAEEAIERAKEALVEKGK